MVFWIIYALLFKKFDKKLADSLLYEYKQVRFNFLMTALKLD